MHRISKFQAKVIIIFEEHLDILLRNALLVI